MNVTFDPVEFVTNLLLSVGNFFYNLWVSLGAWDLLIAMISIALCYRMILVPLFGIRLSGGSDKVSKSKGTDKVEAKYKQDMRDIDRGIL